MLHVSSLGRIQEPPGWEAAPSDKKPEASFSRILSSEVPGGTDLAGVLDRILKNPAGQSSKPPMKFGILQSTLREYDPRGTVAGSVKELNEEKAGKIYAKIWERAGCDLLSRPLNVVHFETFLQDPRKAMDLLTRSRGDVRAYESLRAEAGGWESGAPAAEGSSEKLPCPIGVAYPPPSCSACDSVSNAAAARRIASYGNASNKDFETAVAFVIGQEGRQVVSNDNGKGPSRFGILQTTLRRMDPRHKLARSVGQLDERKARQIYRKIWEDSGCDKLPYPINILHFDTTVHRPKTAVKALRASGGDPAAYLKARQDSLRTLKSYPRFARNWEERLRSLSELIKG